jgi:hypothetical protein
VGDALRERHVSPSIRADSERGFGEDVGVWAEWVAGFVHGGPVEGAPFNGLRGGSGGIERDGVGVDGWRGAGRLECWVVGEDGDQCGERKEGSGADEEMEVTVIVAMRGVGHGFEMCGEMLGLHESSQVLQVDGDGGLWKSLSKEAGGLLVFESGSLASCLRVSVRT